MTKTMRIRTVTGLFLLGGALAGCGAPVTSPAPHQDAHHRSPKATVSASPMAQAKTITMASAQVGWAASSNHIFRTTNGGQHWSTVLDASHIVTMDAVNATTAWVAIQTSSRDVTLTYTNDGGAHWTRHAITAPFSVVRVALDVTNRPASPGSVLLSDPVGTQTGPQALWTIGHGHVSAKAVYHTPSGALARISWSSPTEAWATSDGASSPALMVSKSAGTAWNPVKLPLPHGVPANAVNNPKPQLTASVVASQPPTFIANTGYLSAALYVPYTTSQNTVGYREYAVLFKTTNGTTWTPVWDRGGASLGSMTWASAQNGWAFIAKGNQVRLDHTATGGRTWQRVSTFPRTLNPLSVTFSAHIGWLIAQSTQANTLSLYRSRDNGKQWQAMY